MPEKTIEVGIEADAIEKLGRVSVDVALEELIWNSIDADATKIEIAIERIPDLGGIQKVIVRDNGHGIPFEEAEHIFGSIGGSSKKKKGCSPTLKRPYHGKDGEGRYKAFSIGSRVVWNSRSLRSGQVIAFSVSLSSSQYKSATIGSPVPCEANPGCEVVIDRLTENVSGLDNDARIANLTHRLAPCLMANKGLEIIYDGHLLDIKSSIDRCDELDVVRAGMKIRVVEWNRPRKPSIFLCDKNGLCLEESAIEIKGVRFSYTAYLTSDEILDVRSQIQDPLDVNPEINRIKQRARSALRDHFRARHAEESSKIASKMRSEGIYPYSHLPTTDLEKAEQQVFDICAATVHEYLPQFESSDTNSRKFTYRLLREALESSPTNLSKIFKEVLKLSDEQKDGLAHLLERTSLSSIISSAKTVSDRLKFIVGLEQILHDGEHRKYLLERTQLHRILAEELWIFGEEYSLGGDDVSLRKVLDESRAVMNLDSVPPTNADGLNDVPDLYLWKHYLRGSEDRFENLVIELKRPTVKISQKEIGQVKRYAKTITQNRYFDKEKTHWTFIALSDGVATDALDDVNQRDRKQGHVTSAEHHDIWVLTWQQVIHDAKVRMNWLKKCLQYEITESNDGIDYLKQKYSSFLPEHLMAKND